MRVVVSSIRRFKDDADLYPCYSVDIVVDGVSSSFQFRLGVMGRFSVSTPREFSDRFQGTYAVKAVVAVLMRVHRGEGVAFPVDLGEF